MGEKIEYITGAAKGSRDSCFVLQEAVIIAGKKTKGREIPVALACVVAGGDKAGHRDVVELGAWFQNRLVPKLALLERRNPAELLYLEVSECIKAYAQKNAGAPFKFAGIVCAGERAVAFSSKNDVGVYAAVEELGHIRLGQLLDYIDDSDSFESPSESIMISEFTVLQGCCIVISDKSLDSGNILSDKEDIKNGNKAAEEEAIKSLIADCLSRAAEEKALSKGAGEIAAVTGSTIACIKVVQSPV